MADRTQQPWGVWGVLKTKNFVENVNVKGRVELNPPVVFQNFEGYESPAVYDCPRPN